MNKQTIKQSAWIGDAWLKGPVRGLILAFHGLGFGGLKREPSTVELEWAHAGGLVVFPYYGPWSWMNREARAFVDDLVDSVYAAWRLSDDVPLFSTGGSMGGLSSLLYTRYARRPIAACEAIYPVCDLKAHFTERPDLPPTILSAFRGYPEDREVLFTEHSPTAQAAGMPDIPYLVIHGDKDAAVNKAKHSDRFVAAMRRHKRDVEYLEVPGMDHGGPTPLAVLVRQITFVTERMGKKR